MNVLFCELLYPKTHARSNSFYINCMAELDLSLFVMAPENFYSLKNASVKLLPIEELHRKKGRINYRINEFKYMKHILNAVKKYKIDKIILASSDYAMLPFLLFRLPKRCECFLIHHAELDVLETNKIKRIIFDSFRNKIHHLVFEPFIADFLNHNLKIEDFRVHIMPHSLNKNIDSVSNSKFYCDLAGLSNSNDENFIDDLIKLEQQTGKLKEIGKKIILKSVNHEFDDGYLKVFRGHLPDEEYNMIISGAQRIFMPFENNFGYRESGTLMDALSNGKYVIASDIPLMQNYIHLYPTLCSIYHTAEDVINIISEDICDNSKADEEIASFIAAHSAEQYKKCMSNILKTEE